MRHFKQITFFHFQAILHTKYQNLQFWQFYKFLQFQSEENMTKGHSEYVPFIDELPHIIESFFQL